MRRRQLSKNWLRLQCFKSYIKEYCVELCNKIYRGVRTPVTMLCVLLWHPAPETYRKGVRRRLFWVCCWFVRVLHAAWYLLRVNSFLLFRYGFCAASFDGCCDTKKKVFNFCWCWKIVELTQFFYDICGMYLNL